MPGGMGTGRLREMALRIAANAASESSLSSKRPQLVVNAYKQQKCDVIAILQSKWKLVQLGPRGRRLWRGPRRRSSSEQKAAPNLHFLIFLIFPYLASRIAPLLLLVQRLVIFLVIFLMMLLKILILTMDGFRFPMELEISVR